MRRTAMYYRAALESSDKDAVLGVVLGSFKNDMMAQVAEAEAIGEKLEKVKRVGEIGDAVNLILDTLVAANRGRRPGAEDGSGAGSGGGLTAAMLEDHRKNYTDKVDKQMQRADREDANEAKRQKVENAGEEGLAAGTLPRTAFGAYIAQDHFFLAAFGDAYAQAAKLLPPAVREKHGPAVAALVAGIESERAGHAASAAQWGVTDISSVEPLAATREYCALLAAAAEQGSLGVLFAAAAPCMRLYAWLGVQLKEVARDGTPYHEWCARDTSLRG